MDFQQAGYYSKVYPDYRAVAVYVDQVTHDVVREVATISVKGRSTKIITMDDILLVANGDTDIHRIVDFGWKLSTILAIMPEVIVYDVYGLWEHFAKLGCTTVYLKPSNVDVSVFDGWITSISIFSRNYISRWYSSWGSSRALMPKKTGTRDDYGRAVRNMIYNLTQKFIGVGESAGSLIQAYDSGVHVLPLNLVEHSDWTVGRYIADVKDDLLFVPSLRDITYNLEVPINIFWGEDHIGGNVTSLKIPNQKYNVIFAASCSGKTTICKSGYPYVDGDKIIANVIGWPSGRWWDDVKFAKVFAARCLYQIALYCKRNPCFTVLFGVLPDEDTIHIFDCLSIAYWDVGDEVLKDRVNMRITEGSETIDLPEILGCAANARALISPVISELPAITWWSVNDVWPEDYLEYYTNPKYKGYYCLYSIDHDIVEVPGDARVVFLPQTMPGLDLVLVYRIFEQKLFSDDPCVLPGFVTYSTSTLQNYAARWWSFVDGDAAVAEIQSRAIITSSTYNLNVLDPSVARALSSKFDLPFIALWSLSNVLSIGDANTVSAVKQFVAMNQCIVTLPNARVVKYMAARGFVRSTGDVVEQTFGSTSYRDSIYDPSIFLDSTFDNHRVITMTLNDLALYSERYHTSHSFRGTPAFDPSDLLSFMWFFVLNWPIEDYGFQTIELSQTQIVRTMSVEISKQYNLSNDALHSLRRVTMSLLFGDHTVKGKLVEPINLPNAPKGLKYEPRIIVNSRVTGDIRVGRVSGANVRSPRMVISVSGHILNMLLYGSFSIHDWRRTMDAILTNVMVVSNQLSKHERVKMVRLDKSGRTVENFGQQDKLWHNYYDFYCGVAAYIVYARQLRLPVVDIRAVVYILRRLNAIAYDYPIFTRTMAQVSLDMIASREGGLISG
jgi:hypothetical protein